jgi:periplasmic mercuric ion binding protein
MNRTVAVLAMISALFVTAGAMAAERTVTLAVKNMYCSACPYIVSKSLQKVAGVAKVAVSYEKKTATVVFDDQQASIAALTAATTQAGYPSSPVAESAAAN